MKREQILEQDGVDTGDARLFAQLQARRHSCRKYLPQSVPDDILNRVFALAQLSASWCNAQPWEVIVTRGEGTERFREALYRTAAEDGLSANEPGVRNSGERRSDLPMPSGYSGLRRERRRTAGKQLYKAMGVLGDREASAKLTLENFRFFDAPHAAIISSARELGPYGVLDTGGYISNLMLALECFGISSIAQAALAVYSDFVHEFFDIPNDRILVCGMSFGYQEGSHPSNSFRTERAPPVEVVTWYD